MKEPYKISIIVPIYNIDTYLNKCIESILNQSYKNLEIILVDDGSEDQSGKICDSVAKIDNRILVIHKKNGGLVSARKAGLKVATGDYIGFVDGDDFIEPEFYESLLNNIIINNSDLCHMGFKIEEHGKIIKEFMYNEEIININKDISISLIKDSLFVEYSDKKLMQVMWSKLFRSDFIKECYQKVPNDVSYGEDCICWVISLLTARKISLQKKKMYHYRKREGSYTTRKNIENLSEIWSLYAALKKIFIEKNIYHIFQYDMEKCYLIKTLCNLSEMESLYCYNINIYHFKNIEILNGKRVILYGAGKVGKDFYAQICKYTFCKIVAWVDKNYQNYCYDFTKVEDIKNIKYYQYDYIIIAVYDEFLAMSIKYSLQGQGISPKKILWNKPVVL